MKTDLYTKAVLTVIAVMLTLIAGRSFVHPDVTVNAQALPKLQFSAGPKDATFYFYSQADRIIQPVTIDGKVQKDIPIH